jgi:hypothetical protein
MEGCGGAAPLELHAGGEDERQRGINAEGGRGRFRPIRSPMARYWEEVQAVG